MPTITVSKPELLKSLGKKLSDEELAERISMLGTDLESIEGDEITVEIFPNRPDMLSQQGFARALASFLALPGKTGLKEYTAKPSGITVYIEESTKGCRPYTACAVVRDLKFTEERIREVVMIQEKLHVSFGRNRKRVAIGIYPLEAIKPPIHFKGLKPEEIKFKPLESEREMTARQILDRHPKGRDYAHLVDGLKRYACFVDAKGDIMSFTPIINSELTGKVDERTKDVFIECSGFDLRVLKQCINMIVTALSDMGGTVGSCTMRYKHSGLGTVTSPDLRPTRKRIDLAYVNRVLGIGLKEREMAKLLERMGFGYDDAKKEVLIPPYRTDILHQIDFVEDIAIAYGYENFTPTIPRVGTVGEESSGSKVERKVRELMIGHGLIEMKNYHLVNAEQQETLGAKSYPIVDHPVSAEYDSLRKDPIVSLLSALARNKHHEYPQKIFEIGRGFSVSSGVVEKQYLGVLICAEDAGYTAVRQIADSVARSFGIQFSFSEAKVPWLLDGRAAKQTGVVLGEVHPRMLEAFGIEMPCAALLIDLSALR